MLEPSVGNAISFLKIVISPCCIKKKLIFLNVKSYKPLEFCSVYKHTEHQT